MDDQGHQYHPCWDFNGRSDLYSKWRSLKPTETDETKDNEKNNRKNKAQLTIQAESFIRTFLDSSTTALLLNTPTRAH